MTPKVSVIVTTRNQVHTIGQALNSILSQKVSFPFEIIIGEDASTDNTRAVCQEYVQRYPDIVKLMPAAPNKGLPKNYFECIEAASGEYIADLAGDDFWIDTKKLQMQVDFLDSYPDVVLVHTAWHTVSPDKKTAGESQVQPLPQTEDGHATIIRWLRHSKPLPVHLCTAMYRRTDALNVYRTHRDFLLNQLIEDFTLTCLILVGRKIGYIPVDTLAYTVGGISISNPSGALDKSRFACNSLDVTYYLADMTGTPRRYFETAIKPLVHYAISLAIATHSKDEVKSALAVCKKHKVRLSLKTHIKLLLFSILHRI